MQRRKARVGSRAGGGVEDEDMAIDNETAGTSAQVPGGREGQPAGAAGPAPAAASNAATAAASGFGMPPGLLAGERSNLGNTGHRASCHRCGNLRKRNLKCSNCPHIYCARCAEKMLIEYGPTVFNLGCPVCQKLCCCADPRETVRCNRLYHCYKKCAAAKNAGLTGGGDSMSKDSTKLPQLEPEEAAPIVEALIEGPPLTRPATVPHMLGTAPLPPAASSLEAAAALVGAASAIRRNAAGGGGGSGNTVAEGSNGGDSSGNKRNSGLAGIKQPRSRTRDEEDAAEALVLSATSPGGTLMAGQGEAAGFPRRKRVKLAKQAISRQLEGDSEEPPVQPDDESSAIAISALDGDSAEDDNAAQADTRAATAQGAVPIADLMQNSALWPVGVNKLLQLQAGGRILRSTGARQPSELPLDSSDMQGWTPTDERPQLQLPSSGGTLFPLPIGAPLLAPVNSPSLTSTLLGAGLPSLLGGHRLPAADYDPLRTDARQLQPLPQGFGISLPGLLTPHLRLSGISQGEPRKDEAAVADKDRGPQPGLLTQMLRASDSSATSAGESQPQQQGAPEDQVQPETAGFKPAPTAAEQAVTSASLAQEMLQPPFSLLSPYKMMGPTAADVAARSGSGSQGAAGSQGVPSSSSTATMPDAAFEPQMTPTTGFLTSIGMLPQARREAATGFAAPATQPPQSGSGTGLSSKGVASSPPPPGGEHDTFRGATMSGSDQMSPVPPPLPSWTGLESWTGATIAPASQFQQT